MKAGEVVFQKLLDGRIQYVVPLYQRTYSWKDDQWEQLWNDLLEVYALDVPRNHFIGSIVTQQVPSAPGTVNRYTLIDGQQRMTTLLILLSVIKQMAEAEKMTWGNLADEIQEMCLANKFDPDDQKLKLMPTQSDRELFAKVVAEMSHRLVLKSRKRGTTSSRSYAKAIARNVNSTFVNYIAASSTILIWLASFLRTTTVPTGFSKVSTTPECL